MGSVAVQVAHKRGLTVIGTAGASSLDRLKKYGADRVINYAAERFETSVKDVDAVLDMVGGDTQQRSWAVLKPGGALVAATQPPSPEEAAKHQVKASMVQTEVTSTNLQALARMIDAGEIKPCIGRIYPLNDVVQAWRDSRSNSVDGKIVFTWVA